MSKKKKNKKLSQQEREQKQELIEAIESVAEETKGKKISKKELFTKMAEITELMETFNRTVAIQKDVITDQCKKRERSENTTSILLKTAEGRIDNLEKELTAMKKTVQSLKKENTELKNSLKNLSENITEQNGKVESTLLNLNQAITSLK